jgi:transposase
MHIKKSKVSTKAGTKEYLSLVESYRINGKKKNKTIMSLGRADTVDEKYVQKIIFGLSRLTKQLSIIDSQASESSDPHIKIYESMNLGTTLVIDYLWKELGLSDLFRKIKKKYKKLQFDLELVFKATVIYRLVKPGSERKMLDWFYDVYLPGTEKLQLQHLYRGLAIIAEHQMEIEDHLLEKSQTLFGIDCSLVFFDTTSTYFEGDMLDDKALKQYGRSKDHRPDRRQVKVGMVMSRDGIPIHCPFFAGNESDFTSAQKVIRILAKKERIGEMIFVGDSGMTSQKNIDELKEQNIRYILGSRMRNTKVVKEEVLTLEDVSILKDNSKNQPFGVKKNLFVAEKTINKKRYIICYNPDEAKKDQLVREAIIVKLKSELSSSPKKYIKHRLHKRFLKITAAKTEINQEKIMEEAKYDGLFVIETDTNLSASEVALRYKDLLLVERGFRCLKSTLEMRPIYHKCSENIQGHIFVSYMALYFFCLIIKKLEQSEEGMQCEEGQVLESLARIKAHRTEIHGNRLILRSELNSLNKWILRSLGVKIPTQVLKKW